VCRLFEDPLVSNPSVPLTVSERESNKSGVSHLMQKDCYNKGFALLPKSHKMLSRGTVP